MRIKTMHRQQNSGRKRLSAFVTAAVIGLALPQALSAKHVQAIEPAALAAAPKDISALLEPLVAKHGVPSLAAVVVRGDGTIVLSGASGVRQRGAEEKVTLGDLYHLGSCTKAMTATLCAIMVQEGSLSWDMTLHSALPGAFASAPEKEAADADHVVGKESWKTVTLLQLVSHRSGMPKDLHEGGLWAKLWRFKGEPMQARKVLLGGVLAREPQHPPGTHYEYSNAGFAVAGHIAETKAGVAWETLIQEKLFTPLGITTAGFGAPGKAMPVASQDGEQPKPKSSIDQPRGHKENGSPVQPGPGADNPPAVAPAGTAHMTIADWSKFVALHIRGARRELREADPLRAEAFATLHAPHPMKADATNKDEGYAGGWIVASRPWAAASKDGSRRVLMHAGSNTMWYCVAWVAPERDFAVLVACNQGGDAAVKATDAAAALLIKEFGTLEPVKAPK
jgi:CubicO group peptidase (beta-lactamase class C family)